MIFAVLVFIVVYVWLATEKTPRSVVVLCGSAALLLGRVLTLQEAFHYIDWKILLLLLGLFVLVEGLTRIGVFAWLARRLLEALKGHEAWLFLILPLAAGVLSMAINNITVMVFMTTLTLQICQYVSLEPIPLIVAEVCCANMMGAATLIGSPPNLLMATTLGFGYTRVGLHMTPLVGLSTVLFMSIYYLQHCRDSVSHPSERRLTLPMAPAESFHIDVETLLFFMGLFVLVGGLDRVGVFERIAQSLETVHQPVLLMLAILWLSAIASAFVDNIPMALAMAYLIKSLTQLSPSFPSGIMVWAALMGLTLGGNMTPIGASPNVVAYRLLENRKIKVGWKRWAAITVPGTLLALIATSAALIVQYWKGWY